MIFDVTLDGLGIHFRTILHPTYHQNAITNLCKNCHRKKDAPGRPHARWHLYTGLMPREVNSPLGVQRFENLKDQQVEIESSEEKGSLATTRGRRIKKVLVYCTITSRDILCQFATTDSQPPYFRMCSLCACALG